VPPLIQTVDRSATDRKQFYRYLSDVCAVAYCCHHAYDPLSRNK